MAEAELRRSRFPSTGSGNVISEAELVEADPFGLDKSGQAPINRDRRGSPFDPDKSGQAMLRVTKSVIVSYVEL